MTKEEKIKEAWGYGWEFIDSYKRDDVLHFGWVHILNLNISLDELNITLEQHPNDEWLYRPKSLQGIEDNNGWIKINENLPKQTGYYIMYDCKNNVLIELNDTTDMLTLREQFIKDGFTHYQPIEKPKPPLY